MGHRMSLSGAHETAQTSSPGADAYAAIPAPGWAVGEPITLRLEITGERVEALCSSDGERWYSVGQTSFPLDGDAQVGLHAIGDIDRTIYPGAYPEGTAIRFTDFSLWTS